MSDPAWSSQTVLITGGTGSFGRCCTRLLLDDYGCERVVILSRDELKQWQMRADGFDDPRLRWFLGDVRDRDRLWRAFRGVDVVIHAAAMKQVPACAYNPVEAIRTNVDGTANVIDACLDRDVERLMFISSDKAVDACTLYGSTKATAEHLVVAANAYAGTRCSAVRYGNVIGSRGSIVPLFREQAQAGRLTLTDPAATRFWLTREEAVRFTLDAAGSMAGGEVFIPAIGASSVETVARLFSDDFDQVGLRAGEKMHEALVSPHEVNRLERRTHGFAIMPPDVPVLSPVADGFVYASDSAPRLSATELRAMIAAEEQMASRSG